MNQILTIPNLLFVAITIFLTYINHKIKLNDEDNGLKISVAGLTISPRLISSIILWFAFLGIVCLPLLDIPELLVNICIALYSSSIFAILVTSFINLKNKKLFHEIIDKIDVLNNQDLYRPCQIFKSNWQEKPNEDFFKELLESIRKSKGYIYEGEKARTASMCLKSIQDHFIKDEPIDIMMILREYDVDSKQKGNKDDVIDLFVTLYFLSEILDKKYFNVYVYKRNSITANYVNLTDEKLFFSPFDIDQKYPVTFCYLSSTNSGQESFYYLFKSYMDKRIKNFQKSDNDLYSFFKISEFINAGYFGENISAKGKNILPTSVKNELKNRLEKRIELYKDCLK